MRKLLIVLVVLAALGVGGDRLAARLVADEAESRLAAEGFSGPTVRMHGFPFLTQLAARTFSRVTVTSDALESGEGRAEDVRAALTDVRVPQGGRARIGALTASGTVPYPVVAQAVESLSLEITAAPGGRVQVTRTVELAGQSFDVVAQARVQARGNRLRVIPTDIEVAELPDLDDRLSALIADRVALAYDIPDLPEGLQVEEVTAAENGFVVRVSGRGVSVDAP